MRALLVIDMQKGSFTERTPRFNTSGVVEKINALAAIIRRAGAPVIFVQHDGTQEHAFIPNTTAWELLDEMDCQANDIVVSKTANDAFYQSDLLSVLDVYRIQDLIITRCATDFCVAATVQSALTRDYTVTVVEEGHTTGERPHLTAKQVIDHYNWVWQHMTPTRGQVHVKKFAQIKSSFA